MNDDNYVRWFVERKDSAYVVPVKILMIVVCMLSVLPALQTALGVTAMTIVGVVTYSVFLNLSVEFEYLFTEGGLSVDRILGRTKRKKIFDCEKDNIQIVAPADSSVFKDYKKQGTKVKDFSSDKREAEAYALIYQKGPDHFKVLIEPNERMIGAMRRIFPRKLVIQCNRHMGPVERERAVGDSGMQAALAVRIAF